MLKEYISGLTQTMKWLIIGVLAFALLGVGLKVYTSSKLSEANEKIRIAEQYRAEGMAIRKEAEAIRHESLKIASDLNKANAKLARLQSIVDGIKIPPKPTELPATTAQTLAELRGMGLELPDKPSLRVAPSVAGFTADDAGKVWYWGKEAIRVPALELKIEKQGDLVKGLEKAKTLAELLVESRTQEADKWHEAADKHIQEAGAIKSALTDTQKALKAERKKKILYAVGASALTYAVSRR